MGLGVEDYSIETVRDEKRQYMGLNDLQLARKKETKESKDHAIMT